MSNNNNNNDDDETVLIPKMRDNSDTEIIQQIDLTDVLREPASRHTTVDNNNEITTQKVNTDLPLLPIIKKTRIDRRIDELLEPKLNEGECRECKILEQSPEFMFMIAKTAKTSMNLVEKWYHDKGHKLWS